MKQFDPPTASGASEFDQYADSYSQAVNKSLVIPGLEVDYFTRVKAGFALDLIARHLGDPHKASLLDIGCGVGNFHPLLLPGLRCLAACDVSADSLRVAAERNPGVAYEHYEGERLPFADDSFDAALTICVMHHVPPQQWSGFVAEMKRVLKPGGLAMIFEHNPLNPLTQRVVSNCEFDENAVLLGRATARELLRNVGFSGVTSRAILTIPSKGRVSRRFDEALGVLPFGAQYYAIGRA